MNDKILNLSKKPEIYKNSTSKFWDDEHISKGMLEAHLNPEWDAATRNHKFVCQSIDWISSIALPIHYPKLLDLGCGPGLYTEKFHQRGFCVTGIDISERSIEYARNIADKNNLAITYINKNYLDIVYEELFDVITLIFCDFSVLSIINRKILLDNIYRALKPNGKFIVDVFTPKLYENRKETKDWTYNDGGFWNENSHICLNSFYRYDESNTMLNQTIVITDNSIECYNLWDHTFMAEELKRDLYEARFTTVDLFGDVAGANYSTEGQVICAVATKERKA